MAASKKTTDAVPSVFAVTGGQELLRRRFLQGVIKSWIADGWKLDKADGAVPGELQEVLSQGGSIFDYDEHKTLILVSNPTKADLDTLKEHAKIPGQDIILLLDSPGEPDGRTKYGQFIKTLGKTAHSNHPKPALWDEVEVAVQFCIAEAKSHGKTLDPSLSAGLVRKIGTDLGFLAFEIQKMVMLANEDKSDVLTADHVKGGMAPMAGAIMTPLMDALTVRSKPAIFRSLAQIRKASKDDPTIRITSFMWSTVSKWLAISDLVEQGVGADDGAARLKLNPWYYRNKLLPQVQNWPRLDVIKLVKVLAGAERALLNGGVNPWVVLTVGLLGLSR